MSSPIHVRFSRGLSSCTAPSEPAAGGCSDGRLREAAKPSSDAAEESRPQMELVHQGKLIFDETPRYAGNYVGTGQQIRRRYFQSIRRKLCDYLEPAGVFANDRLNSRLGGYLHPATAAGRVN